MSKIYLTVLALFLATTIGCNDLKDPPFGITIKNDIRDKTYNTIKVDRVRTAAGSRGFSAAIKTRKQVTIPYKGIRFLRLSRRYKGYTKYYEVECPPGLTKGISIKLIDVHVNRIAGGCQLVNVYQR